MFKTSCLVNNKGKKQNDMRKRLPEKLMVLESQMEKKSSDKLLLFISHCLYYPKNTNVDIHLISRIPTLERNNKFISSVEIKKFKIDSSKK